MAIASLTMIVGLFILFIFMLIVGAVALRLVMTMFHSSPRENAEEVKLMQEIHQGLDRMENRVDSLETIIADRDRATP